MAEIRLLNPSFDVWEQKSPEKQIERAGRICYKSEDKIAEGTAEAFVDRMKANKHYAMLEHGTIYLKKQCEVNTDHYQDFVNFIEKYKRNPYSKVVYIESGEGLFKNVFAYITTNLRVLVENGWEYDRKYEVNVTPNHYRRITVHFTLDMGVGREFTRHRVFSFAQESTRYCNYCKEKFGGSIAAIEPEWYKNTDNEEAKKEFEEAIDDANKHYNKLVSFGLTAQEARCVLPLATKSELVMTGFIDEWMHFFDLRALGTTGAPHPDAKTLAVPLMTEFARLGYLKELIDIKNPEAYEV